jgi:large subunit ribosomal protein L17
MRHNKKFNHLGRKSAHRKAMLANMACSLILHKRITTTVAKAKALKMYVEPLMTKSKEDTTQNRRVVFSNLKSKTAVSELFREISAKIADRPGGYTRILKTGNRLGDNAEMCIIELVDYNDNMLATKEEKKAPSRRRRSSGKKKTEAPAAPAAEANVEDATVVEESTEETVAEETTVEETPAEDAKEDAAEEKSEEKE